MKDDAAQASPGQLVTPVIRGMKLLRYIAEGGNTSNLSEVGRLIDVNRVTIMRLLATLQHDGLIEALPQGGHRLSTGFLAMAAASLGSLDLVQAGRRYLESLCRDLGASVYLVLPDGNDVLYVAREMPEGGLVSHIRVGSRVPDYLTAPGRAMLACFDAADIARRFTNASLQQVQAGNPATVDALQALLAEVREQGCAWSFSGYEKGINACAAAVRAVNGKPLAALSVVGPEQLFDKAGRFQARVQALITSAAQDLSVIAQQL